MGNPPVHEKLSCHVPKLTCGGFTKISYPKYVSADYRGDPIYNDRPDTGSQSKDVLPMPDFHCLTLYLCKDKNENSTHHCDIEGMKVVDRAHCMTDRLNFAQNEITGDSFRAIAQLYQSNRFFEISPVVSKIPVNII